MIGGVAGEDPRAGRPSDDLTIARDDGQPMVGRVAGITNPILVFAVFALLAVALFLLLNARRSHLQTATLITPASSATAPAIEPAPPPLDLAPKPAPVPVAPPAPPLPPPAPVVAKVVPPAAPLLPPVDPTQRRRAPSVVVDLQSPNGAPVAIAATTAAKPASAVAPAQVAGSVSPLSTPIAGSATAATAGASLAAGLAGASSNSYDQLTARAASGPPEPAVASELGNLSSIITQGATLPAVLETAIDSDLPGYTRAVISRDVRSFDGKAILIPRGSRVIGQYRSAIALGQSRVFVIWERVIRPDGVSVQIASPGTDALGRGGVGGEVNTHFFSRFGGSILLSVLNAGIAALGHTPSTQITIGSPAAAAGAAASASIDTGSNIGPTVKVKQGVAINIFVARDLDFSGVKAVK